MHLRDLYQLEHARTRISIPRERLASRGKSTGLLCNSKERHAAILHRTRGFMCPVDHLKPCNRAPNPKGPSLHLPF